MYQTSVCIKIPASAIIVMSLARAGLDTCLAIMKVIYEETGDSKYRPCPLLRQYVDAGLPLAVRSAHHTSA